MAARSADEVGSTLLDAFFVGYAGTATPVKANALAYLVFAPTGRRSCDTIDASLPIPRLAAPNGTTMAAIAEPVATFAVRRAVAVGDVLGPNAAVRLPKSTAKAQVTILHNGLIERRKIIIR